MAFEFNETSQKQLDWLLERYPTKQACLLPAFRLVEAQLGYVSEEAMKYVARVLELAPAYVYGVFTFYTQYRREGDGKYIVMVCQTLPCALSKAHEIVDAFKAELKLEVGQTDAEKRFTLKKVECLGSCTTAPVAQINDDYFELLTPEKVREIVAALRKDEVPPHISNGPTLEGGCQGYLPMVEACPTKKKASVGS